MERACNNGWSLPCSHGMTSFSFPFCQLLHLYSYGQSLHCPLRSFYDLKSTIVFICLFSIIFWLFPSIVIEENLLVRSSEGGKAGLETVKVADFRTSLCCTQKANTWARNLFVSFYWPWRLNSLWTLTELPVSFATETIFLLQETTESQHVPWQANFSISWAAILSQTLFLKMLVESSQKQNPNWPGVCIG